MQIGPSELIRLNSCARGAIHCACQANPHPLARAGPADGVRGAMPKAEDDDVSSVEIDDDEDEEVRARPSPLLAARRALV